jgi:glycosyltransferase involved in cell wall biosynthesis
MARIVTVYNDARGAFRPVDMAYIRWLRISEALARCGHSGDLATNELLAPEPARSPFPTGPPAAEREAGSRLRRVPLSSVRWPEYDAVKTLFNLGFQTLEAHGGAGHPFIISKLGSVVDVKDRDGIYFYGDYRRRLYAVQERINATSAYVTLLSEAAKRLWEELFGPKTNILLVPGAADREIPPPGSDPFPDREGIRVLFAGNIYFKDTQPQANRVLVDKLNRLGRLLQSSGCRLYMIGSGDVRRIDPRHVVYLGAVPHEQVWSYFHHARVGVVIAAGPYMHNNESSKIYHYLRAGLPVVSEAGFPNDHVVRASRLGFVVPNGDLPFMAQKIEEAAYETWDRDRAVRYILENHTWDKRVEVYDRLLRERFP